MQGVSFILFLAVAQSWPSFAFLNNRPFPTFSLESMPDTQFTCREKILGGYYADPETQCQMFHVCVKVAGVGVQDFRFLCPNGTAFDQDHQICAEWEDVDCDATTLYYSSDNFDLYRIGSGFESKAVKYGEDEETFALQRAETGDVRINREQQTQRVNQQQADNSGIYRQSQQRRNNNNDRDIFKTSSSSNFFNNRNNGKENDEDYDDNVNVNQNNDYEQKRKVSRKQQRRPPQTTTTTSQPQRSSSGFSNNFAGSSYIPSTTTTVAPSQRQRVVQRHRISFRAPTTTSSTQSPKEIEDDSPTYSVSTPAPFKQTKQTTNFNYDVPKVKHTKATENYPSNNPQYGGGKQTTPVYSAPTTFAPKPKPFSVAAALPTTFAPRTNAAYAQITQQTVTNFNKKASTTQLNPSTFNQQFSSIGTQKPTTTFTQYTPTVPKITATTPVSRSNRFDETQYDDGAYNAKYDYESDEFLKTAHSQNIANSRNELLAKTSTVKASQPTTTQARATTRTTSENPPSSPNQQPQASRKATTTSKPASVAAPKKAKDVSYDYAYYDSNVNSDTQDYQIDTEIRKSTASA